MLSMVRRSKMAVDQTNRMLQQTGFDISLGLELDDKGGGRETIHSGHFMVSDIDDLDAAEGEEEEATLVVHETDIDIEHGPAAILIPATNSQSEIDVDDGAKDVANQQRGKVNQPAVSIDASLTKLLECMTLVYSGKLTSPRWKTFKGVKMKLKEKIRLNNIIWRCWHLQFVAKQAPLGCQFASPLEGESRNKPEAVVLEGKYLKRGMKTVIAEYKKCRMFYKERARCNQIQDGSSIAMDLDYRWPSWSNSSLTSGLDDEFFMDFSDTLFGTLIPNEPFDFPNPREIARAGIADFIQPGLVQLQPSLDDFMDTFEPLQEILNARGSQLATLPEEGPLPDRPQISMFANNNGRQPSATLNLANFRASPTTYLNPSESSSTNIKIEGATGGQSLLRPASQLQNHLFLNPNFNEGNLNGAPPMIVNPVEPANRIYPNNNNPAIDHTDNCTPEMSETQLLCSTPPSLPSPSLAPQSATASVFALKAAKSKPPAYPLGRRNTVPLRSIVQPKTSLLKPPKLTTRTFPTLLEHQPLDTKPNNIVFHQAATSPTKTQEMFAFHQAPNTANKLKRTPTREELVNYRRHSLAGHAPMVEQVAGKPQVVTAVKDTQFAVPKTKTRGRSRSISGPQNNQSVKSITPKPTQAISLTNISISPPASSFLSSASSLGGGFSNQMPSLLPAPRPMRRSAAASNTGMIPTNQLLAQFLTPGGSNLMSSASSTTPTVTIISSVTTSSPSVPQTLLLSPVTLTSVSGADLSRSLLMAGATGNMFSSSLETLPTSPINSALSPNSPPSAQKVSDANSKMFRPKSDEERMVYKEHKRVCHINAEQKRRCNIKHGFESIHQLVPSLCHNPNAKTSKAAMLQKAVDYIRTLKAERNNQLQESETLKKQIDQLNQTINNYQNQLPASGAPVPCQRTNHMRERFDEYVKSSALRNWKFWIFSLLLEPLLESFSNTVSTSSVEELCETTITWLNQHCSLASLRPVVLNSLRHLSTSTNILTDPSRLPEEATRAVTKKEKSSK